MTPALVLVPLVLLSRDREVRGALASGPALTAVAGVVAALIVALNAFLLVVTFAG